MCISLSSCEVDLAGYSAEKMNSQNNISKFVAPEAREVQTNASTFYRINYRYSSMQQLDKFSPGSKQKVFILR